ncbi:matrixin family metalloprotease [Ruegeria sp. SCSIO 43209]|uniref:matrixin family metalloprotease n=1 Tax=Ruegeria sp. SCSIO 43209 TaxID=2793010 RepID=UPI001CA99014|nr:matrixin family metalloprotease [Ruegeria sp. SCSIO 43209]UAB88260.1 matrixin family metalloprotease [Ruegeria sp. SCSIO 43209]
MSFSAIYSGPGGRVFPASDVYNTPIAGVQLQYDTLSNRFYLQSSLGTIWLLDEIPTITSQALPESTHHVVEYLDADRSTMYASLSREHLISRLNFSFLGLHSNDNSPGAGATGIRLSEIEGLTISQLIGDQSVLHINFGYQDSLNGNNIDLSLLAPSDSFNLTLGDANDTVTGGSQNTIARLGGGNDTFTGGSGIDYIYGEDGDDTLYSGPAHSEFLFDFLYGGADNDVLIGNETTFLIGGSGNDQFQEGIYFYEESLLGGVFVNLSDSQQTHAGATVAGRSAIDEYGEIDTFSTYVINGHASNYNDVVWMNSGYLFARGGNDHVTQTGLGGYALLGPGDDVYIGGPGDENIFGEEGDDRITGGGGIDIAEYSGITEYYDADSGVGDFSIVYTSNGFQLRDRRVVSEGHQGNDTLNGIESILLTDRTGEQIRNVAYKWGNSHELGTYGGTVTYSIIVDGNNLPSFNSQFIAGGPTIAVLNDQGQLDPNHPNSQKFSELSEAVFIGFETWQRNGGISFQNLGYNAQGADIRIYLANWSGGKDGEAIGFNDAFFLSDGANATFNSYNRRDADFGDILVKDSVSGATLESLVIHEIGHAIGLEHTNDSNSIMHDPFSTGAFSELDRQYIQAIYGPSRTEMNIDDDTTDDVYEASEDIEIFNLVSGADRITGVPTELDGDTVVGFGTDDVLILNGVSFDRSDLSVYMGSAILDIDTDKDGLADTTIVLEGDYSGSEFTVVDLDGSTAITVSFPPNAQDDFFYVDEDDFMAGNILANDNWYTGGELTVSLLSGPEEGQLTLNDDGSFTYEADSDVFDLADPGDEVIQIFNYEIEDAFGRTSEATALITVSILGDGVSLSGSWRRDVLVGDDGGEDYLRGLWGRDHIKGLDGADILEGGFGRDKLEGGESADILRGGPGRDVLIGGEGADLFEFHFFDGFDIVTDFEVGIDQIGIGSSLFADDISDIKYRDLDDGVLLKLGGAKVLVEDLAFMDLSEDSFVWV